MSTAARTNAPAVSRVLRAAGFLPVSRAREGLHVFRGVGGATVVADWDSDRASRAASADAQDVLAARGYTVARLTPTMFRATTEITDAGREAPGSPRWIY